MRKILVWIFLLLPSLIFCQVDIKNVTKQSHQVFKYKINSALAEKYIRTGSIDVDAYLGEKPVPTSGVDDNSSNGLSHGQYLFISVRDNQILANLIGVSDLYAYPVNNQNRVQLLILNRKGEFVNNAQVWVNGIPAPFNPGAQSYWITQKKPDNALIKVYTPGDTLLTSIWIPDDREKSILEQKLENFKKSGFVRVISWLPRQIDQLFRKPGKSQYTGARGMIIFNQPKYKQTDTVRLKAYLFNRKYKQYKDPVNIFLEYYANGKQQSVFLKKLPASSPGSYVFQFPLSDSLPSDKQYSVRFKTDDKKTLIYKSFKMEDYLLDEISSYTIRSDKDAYYKGDSLHFFASALNANGLPLLDTRVKLIVTVASVNSFFRDSMYVPDTLFVSEKPLLTTGDTRFDFSTLPFPEANLTINAMIQFRNGNNEMQEKNIDIDYHPGEHEFKAYVENDSVVAEYRVDGKLEPSDGKVEINNEWFDERNVRYPVKLKIDPFADKYSFYLLKNGVIEDSSILKIENRYSIELARISQGDTLGFYLYNPGGIPVSFTVFDGNTIIGAGKSSEKMVQWIKTGLNKNRLYRVSWQYYWRGEEQIEEEKIALLYKLLKIDIHGNSTVFPGQRDTISINVKDYLNKPVRDVNLTALSYNNQFSKDIQVSEPPYLVNYKYKPYILRDKFEQTDVYILKRYPLGQHQQWIRLFGLDTMLYYKMLFPDKPCLDIATQISEFIPETSVHIVKTGERQEIYMLYINRNLVYYNGVTEKMKDAYQTFPGSAQLGIRLYDQFIEIDSIYIQAGYKHDLFIDLDKLPAHTKVVKLKPVYTPDERELLENSLFKNDFGLSWYTQKDTGNYIWQNERLVHMGQEQVQILGPFRKQDSLQFYSLNHFDIKFPFEPGYQYEIFPQMVRLERSPVFPDQKEIKLPVIKSPEWILGDTIPAAPVISYTKSPPVKMRRLAISRDEVFSKPNELKGSLRYSVHRDTIIQYVVLMKDDQPDSRIILKGDFRFINRIPPGLYSFFLIDKNFRTAEIKNLVIKNGQTLCINAKNVQYRDNNKLVDQWAYEVDNQVKIIGNPPITTNNFENMPAYQSGGAAIMGKVIDQKGGLGISFASIKIKGSKTGTSANADGNFSIRDIKPGRCTLLVYAVGYVNKEVAVQVSDDQNTYVTIFLNVSMLSLNEVIVTGYGIQRKKDLTGSVTMMASNNLTETFNLQGRVSGIEVRNGEPGSADNILIRGNSANNNGRPLYIVDGIFYDEMPGNISEDMILSINVLKDAEATSKYGSRGAAGIIEITTKTKGIRNQFRDYAFWKPELFTDENGQVKFSVQYPDNITGWQTYVLAMDKKRRMGRSFKFISSYKPLMAQLNLPQFLVIGDEVEIIGKSLNYSKDQYRLQTGFSVNGQKSNPEEIVLNPKESFIQRFMVRATGIDSMLAAFNMNNQSGFKDGEERKIPVMRKGIMETKGNFWILNKDTSVNFSGSGKSETTALYAQNNTLDILLNEIDNLKKYPYYCMEQTSSKLRGLLMEKQIREKLGQPFKSEKDIQPLISKIQKGQLYEGSWSWWENGKASITMTNYVINALLPIRSQGMIETNVRNGLLYLQNQLNAMNKEDLFSSLLTMSRAKHLMNYSDLLKGISFDSLTIHQQWEYVRILQYQNLNHTIELNKLMKKGITGILGGMHWGEENYHWYSDEEATTVLAFDALMAEKVKERELNAIFQYFLELRKTGYWRNTVSSASIVSALLPYALSNFKNFTQPARLEVTGDTSFIINEFPYKWVSNNSYQNIRVEKTGGGLTYLTLYQNNWNENPRVDSNYFKIRTYFLSNGTQVSNLVSGEKEKMVVEVDVLKEAEYIMMEIPIPAGCVYGSKNQDEWNVHKEFLKNKVVLFSEKMPRGSHKFEVDLESRYNGRFTVNPVKVSLMYFPVFYGIDEIKQISIQP